MENNENMNLNEKQNSNTNGKKANRTLTIVLISIIIVLVLGIGIVLGLLFSGKGTQIINNISENNIEQTNNIETNDDKNLEKEYNTVKEEIIKCLNDVKWLKENNIFISGTDEEIYYIQLLDNNSLPCYMVCTKWFDASYARIISYENGKVKVGERYGADYGQIKIDEKNNIVHVDGSMFSKYFKIIGSDWEIIDSYDLDSKDIGVKKYQNYSFKEIGEKFGTKVKIDTSSDSNATITNSEYEKTVRNTLKQYNLKNISSVAVKSMDIYKTFEGSSAKYKEIVVDINNDGVNDIIKYENSDDYHGSIVYFNNEPIFKEIESGGCTNIYVADLNKSDKYLDIVIRFDFASADYAFCILKYNGKTMEAYGGKDNVLYGDEMYINQSDIIVVQEGCFVNASPVVSNAYYIYSKNQMINLNPNDFKNELINFKNVYFTTDLKNIGKVMECDSGDASFEEALKKANIEFHNNINAYIVEFDKAGEGNTRMKVRLENGTEGYIFTNEGNFAG